MRLSLTVSDEVNEKLEDLAKKFNTSKSAICNLAIGQYVYGMDMAFKKIENASIEDLIGKPDKD